MPCAARAANVSFDGPRCRRLRRAACPSYPTFCTAVSARRPVDRSVERHEMLVGCCRGCRGRAPPADAPKPSRSRRRGRRPCARGRSRGRCRRRALQICFHEVHERGRARQLVRDHFERDRDAERLRHLRVAPRRSSGRRRARSRPARGSPRCTTKTPNGMRRAICSACSASSTACARVARSALASVSGTSHRPFANPSATGACTRVQLEPRLGEPLLQIGDGRRAVIVEVRPRGEQFDALEAVRRDFAAGDPGSGAGVIQVRRHAERTSRHKAEIVHD